MTLYQFIASLVGSLAWPLAAIIGLLLLRPVLNALARRVRTLEYGGMKADLEALDRASIEPARAKPENQIVGPDQLRDERTLIQLVAASPSTAVEQAWRRLRNSVSYAAYAVTNENQTEEVALETLHKGGILPTGARTLYPILSSIRQRVFYDAEEIAPAAALEFVVQADRMAGEIERAVAPPAPHEYPD